MQLDRYAYIYADMQLGLYLCRKAGRPTISLTYAGDCWQPAPQGQVIRVTELQ